MVKRYELSDEQWARIAELLPGKKSDPGRTAAGNRLFVNAVLWVLRSGARWSDLPERYGKSRDLFASDTQSAVPSQQARLPLAKSHRALLQQAQALPSHRHLLRPSRHLLPRAHPPRQRHAMDAQNVDSA